MLGFLVPLEEAFDHIASSSLWCHCSVASVLSKGYGACAMCFSRFFVVESRLDDDVPLRFGAVLDSPGLPLGGESTPPSPFVVFSEEEPPKPAPPRRGGGFVS